MSPTPWNSLNLNWHNGDLPERVTENHRRALRAVDRELASFCDAHQVHGNNVFVYKEPISINSKPEADALLTKNSQVTLGMRYADCVPVLLFDPVHQVAGIAHSGWRGTVKRVSAKAVRRMENEFGSDPTNIIAAIGPSICAKHYQVGLEVIEEVENVFGKNTSSLIQENGSTHFDLWSANKQVLSDVGVSQIEIAGLCTACDPDNWFSYRAEDKKTGGFAAIIGLKR